VQKQQYIWSKVETVSKVEKIKNSDTNTRHVEWSCNARLDGVCVSDKRIFQYLVLNLGDMTLP
jgi:hypothetical protein